MPDRPVRSAAKSRPSATSALLIGAAVGVLALPSAVLALTTGLGPVTTSADSPVAETGFQPAQVDPRLARSISVRALNRGQTFRFTPAAAPGRIDREVTIAVRVDSRTSRGVGASAPLTAAEPPADSSFGIVPTAYNLGVSRGYKGFAQGSAPKSVARTALVRSDAQIPDLKSFAPSTLPKGDPGRFAARITLDDREQAGRAPRTLQGQADEVVDLGGSYRLSRNLNVTAGVRSTSDRDRLAPLSDGRKDNQAVYVGTQFKF